MSKQLTKSQKAMLRDRRARFLKNPTFTMNLGDWREDRVTLWYRDVRDMFPTERIFISYQEDPLMDTFTYRAEIQ